MDGKHNKTLTLCNKKGSECDKSCHCEKTVGDLPVFRQARSYAYPLCCEILEPRLPGGSYVRSGSWRHLLFECSPTGQLLITRLYHCTPTAFYYGIISTALVRIDRIKIPMSDKAVLLILSVYNRTWFAVDNTRHPHVCTDMLPTQNSIHST